MRVFGYGSLVVPGAEPFVLEGWRRVWGVAMDNRVAIPGYKVYEDPATGERPAVFVAFLDLVPDPRGATAGTLLDAPDLAALDRRERNYRRTALRDGVVAYLGTPDARRRLSAAVAEGTAVITREYLRRVSWPGAPPLPVCDLRRIDL